ncbi:hypothetical protein [Pseudomonas veronii]
MDEPYPENLMAAPACRECNNGLSLDEEYLACLLECVIAGDIAPEKLHRAKIGRILRANSSLLTRLQRARTDGAEGPVWAAENDRVSRVILKLARCHAAFELNEPQLHEPSRLGFKPLSLMTEKERTAFESDDDAFDVWPEVGSRAMQTAEAACGGHRHFHRGMVGRARRKLSLPYQPSQWADRENRPSGISRLRSRLGLIRQDAFVSAGRWISK